MRKSITVKFTERYRLKGLDFSLVQKQAKSAGLTINEFVLECLVRQIGLEPLPEQLEKLEKRVISIEKLIERN